MQEAYWRVLSGTVTIKGAGKGLDLGRNETVPQLQRKPQPILLGFLDGPLELSCPDTGMFDLLKPPSSQVEHPATSQGGRLWWGQLSLAAVVSWRRLS